VGGLVLNGSIERRLPHNLNVRFERVHGETLLKALASDVAVSSGAACATTSAEPSHVLRALGLTDEEARASIRFGLSRFTSADEIETAAMKVSDRVKQLRRGAS
jgi:cysteine desulfurase